MLSKIIYFPAHLLSLLPWPVLVPVLGLLVIVLLYVLSGLFLLGAYMLTPSRLRPRFLAAVLLFPTSDDSTNL